MPEYPAASERRPHEITLLVVAVAAAGLNLRTAITSLPPLFPDLASRLHLSSAELSLLAATPVICFGVVSAFAAWLNRRVRARPAAVAYRARAPPPPVRPPPRGVPRPGPGARPGKGVRVRAHLAGPRVQGPAEPALLRAPALAPHDLPGPGRVGGHRR